MKENKKIEEIKICKDCKVEKLNTIEYFVERKLKSGEMKIQRQCLDCRKKQSAKTRKNRRDKIKELESQKEIIIPDFKCCTKCNIEKKNTNEFFQNIRGKDGKLTHMCKECISKALSAGRTPLKIEDVRCCKQCNIIKENTEENFYRKKRKTGKIEISWICRECVRKNDRDDYREKHPFPEGYVEPIKIIKEPKIKIEKPKPISENGKICAKCNIEKENIEENFARKSKNGQAYIAGKCKDCEREDGRESYAANAENILNRLKEKRKTDIFYKIRTIVSCAVRGALKNNNASKNGSKTWDHMPSTQEDMAKHLETLFSHPDNLVPLDISWHGENRVWMTWDNWEKYNPRTWKDNDPSTWTWNLDHIIPQSDLPYTSMKDSNFKKSWSLSNLRPYSAKQNIKDGANKIRHKNKLSK